jgi:hypothetical protein
MLVSVCGIPDDGSVALLRGGIELPTRDGGLRDSAGTVCRMGDPPIETPVEGTSATSRLLGG